MEDSLACFTGGTGDDKVPLEGLAGWEQHWGKLANFCLGKVGPAPRLVLYSGSLVNAQMYRRDRRNFSET